MVLSHKDILHKSKHIGTLKLDFKYRGYFVVLFCFLVVMLFGFVCWFVFFFKLKSYFLIKSSEPWNQKENLENITRNVIMASEVETLSRYELNQDLRDGSAWHIHWPENVCSSLILLLFPRLWLIYIYLHSSLSLSIYDEVFEVF